MVKEKEGVRGLTKRGSQRILVVRSKKKVCTLFKRVAILWLHGINVWTEGLNRVSILSLKSSGRKTYSLFVSSLRHSGNPSETVAKELFLRATMS